jgi:sugar O-acyltransferase (sialic acid O-acetyltransferase NeuD family)
MLTKLALIGKSEATICYIIDALEYAHVFADIEVVNNLSLPIEHAIDNPKFNITITTKLSSKKLQCMLGASNPSTKMKLFDSVKDQNLKFMTLLHPTAIISKTTKPNIGRGCFISTMVTIGAHSEIGDFVTLSTKSSIGHHVTIGDFVTLNPGSIVSGHCNIGKGTSIGVGAVVSDHVNIGENVIIGAGAVVVRDIPSNVIAYGNPCKPQRENGPRSA